MTLKQVDEKVEQPVTGTEEASKNETPKPGEESSPEPETPTLTVTQYNAELAKKTGELQGGFDRRHTLLETRLSQANETIGKHEAAILGYESDNRLASAIGKYKDSGGDAESVEAEAERGKKLSLRESVAGKKEAANVAKEHEIFMANRYLELEKEHGIPKEQLYGTENEYEAKIKALEYEAANPKKPEVKPKKVDSVTGTGTSKSMKDMTPEEKVNKGLIKFK